MNEPLKSKSIAEALPAFSQCFKLTGLAVAKITPEIADFRAPSPDGGWHFSLIELAAHIADGRMLTYSSLSGAVRFDALFMLPPEGFHGQQAKWTPRFEFTLADVHEYMAATAANWERVAARPIDGAHMPGEPEIAAFEDRKKQIAEGKMPAGFAAGNPPNALGKIVAMMTHECAHRGTLITVLRTHLGVSFSEGWV